MAPARPVKALLVPPKAPRNALANAHHGPNATGRATKNVKRRVVAARNVVHPRPSALANVRPPQAAMSALVNAAVAQAHARQHAVRDREEDTRSARRATGMIAPAVRVVPVASAQARVQRVVVNGREHVAHAREGLVPNGARAAKGNAPSAKDAVNAPQANAHGHPPNAHAMPL
jgi:hypothetical protein